jgi:hypothetical protein
MRFIISALLVLSLLSIIDAFLCRSSIVRSKKITNISLKNIPSSALFSTEGASDEEVKERQLSDTMKSKLMKEIQNNAGDPNYSQGPVLGNPILIVSIVISILAISLKAKGYI